MAMLAAALIVVVGWFAPTAGAHAVLMSTDPDDGATLETPPGQVTLEFNEPVVITGTPVELRTPDGGEVTGLASQLEGASVVVTLPDLTEEGSYTVAWRVVSADGHPISGAFLFHLGAATLTEPLEVGDGGSLVGDLLRSVGIVAALAGAIWLGVVLVGRPSWRARPARGWVGPWNAMGIGTLLVLGGSVVAVGGDLAESMEVVLATSSGRAGVAAWVLAVVGLLTAAARVPGWVSAAAGAAAIVALSLSGHALSLPPLAVSAPATVVHVLAAVVWLVALVWLWRRGPVWSTAELRRVTPWAATALVALGVSGVVLVLQRVPVDGLATSTYGRLALLKSVLLLGAAALAAHHRFRVAPRLDDDPSSSRALRRTLGIEVLVVAGALVAGAVLAQVPPPEEDRTDGGMFVERVAFGDGEVEVSVEPGRRGTNELHVIALGDDGRLMADVDEFVLELSLPSDDIGPLVPEIVPVTNGHVMSFAEIPLGGDWELEVIGRVGRFEERRATFEVSIGG